MCWKSDGRYWTRYFFFSALHVFWATGKFRRQKKIACVECGLCALRNGIQTSMEVILKCHPPPSTEWLNWVAVLCEQRHNRTCPIDFLYISMHTSRKCTQSNKMKGTMWECKLGRKGVPRGRRRRERRATRKPTVTPRQFFSLENILSQFQSKPEHSKKLN